MPLELIVGRPANLSVLTPRFAPLRIAGLPQLLAAASGDSALMLVGGPLIV